MFETIGVSVKWVFYRLFTLLYNEKAKSFAEIRNGPEDYNSLEQTVYNVSNIVLGVLTVIISILVVKQLGI